jgi:hypothetical protein
MPLGSSSSFRRSGQRDDRRRRLLADELANPSDWPACHAWPEDAPQPQKSEHYGDAGFLEQQVRLLDLVPRRMLSLLLLLATGAAILVGLEVSYLQMLDRVAHGGAPVTALDLAAKGSLGCWFSSLMLLAASATSVLVYNVRRHRSDDYQGRYRIWLWAAACWFLLATDQAASLREAFRDLMIVLTGTTLVGNGTLWWVIFYTLVLGAVGSRLVVDMRSSLLSTSLLVGAALAQTLAVAARFGWILPQDGCWAVVWLAGAEMTGNLMLLAATVFHARFVILDAEGLLPRREPQPDDELTEEEAADDDASSPSATDRWMKIDSPHTTPPPAFQRTAPLATSSALSPGPAPFASPANPKLTKAERKAMKERLLRERLERQRRGM